MNRLTQGAIGVGITISSFGVGGNSVEASGNLPNNCTVYPVGEPVNSSAETALLSAGFGGIIANGRIDEGEQYSVYQAQKTMKEAGVLAQDTKICGYAGEVTRNAAKLMLKSQTITGNSQTDTSDSNTAESNTEYEVEDCSRYDELAISTIKELQNALDIHADGIFGDQSCNAVIRHQINIGIPQGQIGMVGPKTLNSLGVVAQVKANINTSFDPKKDCPTRTTCEIVEDLNTQTGMVKLNDWNNKTANGETLFTYQIQSGRPGSETDTGLFLLGPVEYGANGNPWRTSTLGSSNGEPNLYKFRRHIPFNGGWSGEGTHGSNAFGFGKGSSGCSRVTTAVMDVLSNLPRNILLWVKGIKPS